MIDIIGKRFGRLVVLRRAPNRGRRCYSLCRCSCGTEKEISHDALIQGHSRSCGCLFREWSKKTGRNHKPKHGDWGSDLYYVLAQMKSRCQNKGHRSYHSYGGRGISVCEAWQDYDKFRSWALANGYKKGLSIDRRNNDGGYCPENCRWTNQTVQMDNTRTNRIVFWQGKNWTITRLAEHARINSGTLRYRLLRAHWPIKLALKSYR